MRETFNSIQSSGRKKTKFPDTFTTLFHVGPGLLLTSGLVVGALWLRTLPGLSLLSLLILAILLGILVRNTVGVPYSCQSGIRFALKRILRLAIILLGLQLSVTQILTVGFTGFFIIAFTLVSTFGFTCWIGQRLGVGKRLSCLIATGTSICGASAVVATSATIDSSDEDGAYAVAIVTVFGTLSMLLYPILASVLPLTPEAFGIWCGVSIHEVAQVIAAAFQVSASSGEIASITKLSRVLSLIPMMMLVSLLFSRTRSHAPSIQNTDRPSTSPPIPWFVFGFVILVVINSMVPIPQPWKMNVNQVNQLFLAIAMTAMGLETKLNTLKTIGLKPLYLGAVSWLFISVLSLGLVAIAY